MLAVRYSESMPQKGRFSKSTVCPSSVEPASSHEAPPTASYRMPRWAELCGRAEPSATAAAQKSFLDSTRPELFGLLAAAENGAASWFRLAPLCRKSHLLHPKR